MVSHPDRGHAILLCIRASLTAHVLGVEQAFGGWRPTAHLGVEVL
jgi:hypothetical protein